MIYQEKQDTNGRRRLRRGFAAMDPERQREIARQGGRAAHERGTAHEFSVDEAREAGRRGGATVSQNRDHMANIGRRGGATVSQDRDQMAAIGQLGGLRSAQQRNNGNGLDGDGATDGLHMLDGDGATDGNGSANGNGATDGRFTADGNGHMSYPFAEADSSIATYSR